MMRLNHAVTTGNNCIYHDIKTWCSCTGY